MADTDHDRRAELVAPLFVHPNGLLQCGWCLQTIGSARVADHRQMHVEAIANLSALPQYDGRDVPDGEAS